ncbi:MAG TPA: hypothetical protein VEH05_10080 [Streptosporangiaceae bacterium]|nr:hypothetical protein [Streptosporangiaceae bacterium]
MKNGQTYPSTAFQLNKTSMMTGAVLFGTGGLIGLIGMIVSGTALAAACRQWFRELDVPPTEAVKHKWGQTKAASAAGAAAWQQHDGVQRTHA